MIEYIFISYLFMFCRFILVVTSRKYNESAGAGKAIGFILTVIPAPVTLIIYIFCFLVRGARND